MLCCTLLTLSALASVALGATPTEVYDGEGTGFCTAPTGPSACYTKTLDGEERLISGCSCHASCATCGYGSTTAAPFRGASGSNDCITCPDGSTPTPVNLDNTGNCTAKTGPSECYYGAAAGGAKIAGCMCDAGCATCGYGGPWAPSWSPFLGASGSNDCITCTSSSKNAKASGPTLLIPLVIALASMQW